MSAKGSIENCEFKIANLQSRAERLRGLWVNFRQVWVWYRGTLDLPLRRLRRRAVQEVIREIRKARKEAA